MQERTQRLWEVQDQHVGDRQRLFTSIAEAVDVGAVLYPGSYVDLAPSFVWPSVTYVDVDRRAQQFFDDEEYSGPLRLPFSTSRLTSRHNAPVRSPDPGVSDNDPR